MKILRVAVPLPLYNLFDYLPPVDACLSEDWVGTRVLIHFGRQQLIAVVVQVSLAHVMPSKLKHIEQKLDDQPFFTTELVATLMWAAQYYARPVGEVFNTALPVFMREYKERRIRPSRAVKITALGREQLELLEKRRKTAVYHVLSYLSQAPATNERLTALVPQATRVLRRMLKQYWVEEAALSPELMQPLVAPPLNTAQQDVLRQLQAQVGFRVFALLGITGSGKTEVYFEYARQILMRGKQVLILVPEIGLTPQLLQRFRDRFGFTPPALHSSVASGERAAVWQDMGRGVVPVVIGTRSAVFVPFSNPGLIILDEEHDLSYKQQEGFRYHARDVAIMRAKALNIPILLGSATPALETLANIDNGRYSALFLTERAGHAVLPDIRTIDVRQQKLQQGLSQYAMTEIQACLARGEHVLIFRNQRGYAPVLFCHACGWRALCPQCDKSLILHKQRSMLCCHRCDYAIKSPLACPQCRVSDLLPMGVGTERLEEYLCSQFPEVPVLRIDRDTTRRRGTMQVLLEAAVPDKPAILVGTQMLAKGHDLPQITLVLLVDVDQGLYSADFRATERLAQLIVQVAGRAGRGYKKGVVLLQTHQPEHPLFADILHHDYLTFARQLLQERQLYGFPPFVHWVTMRTEAKQSDLAQQVLKKIKGLLVEHTAIVVHGPIPTLQAKKAGYFQYQLLLESATRAALQMFLQTQCFAIQKLPEMKKVRFIIDVDPVDGI